MLRGASDPVTPIFQVKVGNENRPQLNPPDPRNLTDAPISAPGAEPCFGTTKLVPLHLQGVNPTILVMRRPYRAGIPFGAPAEPKIAR